MQKVKCFTFQQMKEFQTRMDPDHFKKYTTKGSNNQTIDQVPMLTLKTRGELAHVKGITTATQDKAVYVLKDTKILCQSNENFSNVQSMVIFNLQAYHKIRRV